MNAIARKQNPLLVAVLAALVLHVLFFLAFVLLVHTGYFAVAAPEPEIESTTTLTLVQPPPLQEPVVPQEAAPEPPPRGFVDATAAPEEAPPESAPFISDRNVTAAAENPGDTGDLPIPSQEGLDLPGLSLTEQQYTDGPGQQPAPNSVPQPPQPQLAAVPRQSPPPQQQQQEPREQPQTDQARTPTEQPEQTPAEEIEPRENPDQPLDDPAEDPQPIEDPAEIPPETPPEDVAQPEDTRDLEYDPALDPDLLALLEARSPDRPQAPEPLPAPRTQPREEPRAEQTPQQQPTIEELMEAQRRRAAPLSQSSFQRERALTELQGSITNKGNNNVGSEKTPLGAYYKSISEAVSRVWHERTSRNFDLFRIGTVKIRFRVYPSGKVTGITVTENTGNEVFANVTIEAIQNSPIPEMPADVRALTQGEPLSIEYTFVMY